MPHYPKPFFRTARGAWFLQVRGKWINLGPERDKAFSKYHELMAQPSPADQPREAPSAGQVELVVAVIDAFLDFVQKHRAADTYRWYKDRLQRFVNFIPVALTLSQLKPFHVQRWIDSYPDHSAGTRRNYCRSIQRAMHWAEEQGYVERSPLAHLKKPRGGRKEQVVSTEQFSSILAHVGDQAFADLLTVTWETGARPQETLRVEARHVTILAGYFAANCPKQNLQPFGSFEGWSDLVRQAIVWVGLPDPCLTRQRLIEYGDTETDVFEQVIRALRFRYAQNEGIVVAQMLRQLYDPMSLAGDATSTALRAAIETMVGCPPGKTPTARQVGNRFRSYRRRVVVGYFLDFNPQENHPQGAVWRIQPAASGSAVGTEPSGGGAAQPSVAPCDLAPATPGPTPGAAGGAPAGGSAAAA